MKDPNAMTVEECRDELARNAGYKPTQNHWHHPGHGCCHFNSHPIPATLDEAAKLPEGWYFSLCQQFGGNWGASASKRPLYETKTGTTELEARFRLRVAVERLARQGEGGGE